MIQELTEEVRAQGQDPTVKPQLDRIHGLGLRAPPDEFQGNDLGTHLYACPLLYVIRSNIALHTKFQSVSLLSRFKVMFYSIVFTECMFVLQAILSSVA